MSLVDLRDFQQVAYEDIWAGFDAGHLRQCVVGPTGCGKTPLAIRLMQDIEAEKGNASFVVDRVVLVEQASERFMEYDFLHGIMQGENTMGRLLPIQVCSAQTLESRERFPASDLYIIDECHTQRRKILEALVNQGCRVIGLTATPFADGMGAFYSRVVNLKTTNQLIEDGWLSPLRVYSCKEIDMKSAVTNNQGEWLDSEVESRTLPVIGNIVSEWVRYTTRIFGRPVKTLAYTATVGSGAELCRQFQEAGFPFEQVSYLDRNDNQRRSKVKGFRESKYTGLISCEALVKGADFKDVECIIDARPYRTSYMAHLQQWGRGMRICPEIGKRFCLVLDHGGNAVRHAEVRERFWAEGCDRLSDVDNDARRQQTLKKSDTSRKCRCGFVMEALAQVCPMCGRERRRRAATRTPQNKPGRMEEYKTIVSEVGDIWPHVSAYALEKEKKKGPEAVEKRARRLYKDITGEWPTWGRAVAPAEQCDPRVRDKIVRLARQKYIVRTKMAGRRK